MSLTGVQKEQVIIGEYFIKKAKSGLIYDDGNKSVLVRN